MELDKETKQILRIFKNVLSAKKWVNENLNKEGSAISKCCNHKKYYKTAYDFIWEFI